MEHTTLCLTANKIICAYTVLLPRLPLLFVCRHTAVAAAGAVGHVVPDGKIVAVVHWIPLQCFLPLFSNAMGVSMHPLAVFCRINGLNLSIDTVI